MAGAYFGVGLGGSGCVPFWVENRGQRVDEGESLGNERFEVLCFRERLQELKTPRMAL